MTRVVDDTPNIIEVIMKTNQIMTVNMKYGNLEIGHLDHMGDLNQVFIMGNKYRAINNLASRHLQDWLKLTNTVEFIKIVENTVGFYPLKATKGKNASTRAHLYVLLDAAVYLSAEFKLEVYECFVKNKLLQYRDLSGDKFIELNSSVSLNAEQVFGKPSHNGHYINLAKIIKSRVLSENHAGWNYANPAELTERTRIEMLLSEFLKNNLVRDWEHLKELAAKV